MNPLAQVYKLVLLRRHKSEDLRQNRNLLYKKIASPRLKSRFAMTEFSKIGLSMTGFFEVLANKLSVARCYGQQGFSGRTNLLVIETRV